MAIADDIRKELKKVPYGLTPEEVAAKTGINEKTALTVLEKMSTEKSVKKARAGSVFFYKLVCITLFFLLVATSYAQELESGNYTIVASIADSGGGTATSTSYSLSASIGGTTGNSTAVTLDLCSGFVCSFFELVVLGKVTFVLDLSINGTAGDQAYVDNFTQLRQYIPSELINYYACIQDDSYSGTPTFGIVFAGSSLNYINISESNSFALRVSQDIRGNEFILPITSGNCTVINARMPQIAQFGTILQPFVLTGEVVNAIELALSYPAIQIAGSFDRTGAFTLIMEKNATNPNQVIVRPV